MGQRNEYLHFCKKMFKATSKDSKFYIASIVVTMIFMFNTINISYNEAIYSTSEKTYTIMELVREPGSYDLKTVPFYYSAQEIQQKSLIIMFFVVIFFTSISSMDYIKKRTKETAFIVSNGSYILDIVRYVGYMGGKCFFLGGTIGILQVLQVYLYLIVLCIRVQGKFIFLILFIH